MFPSEMALRIMLISSAVLDFFCAPKWCLLHSETLAIAFRNVAYCIPKSRFLFCILHKKQFVSRPETVCFSVGKCLFLGRNALLSHAEYTAFSA